ncbi:MAG: PA14 domain-containing protein [Phycisphaerales bacterium]
MSSIFSRAAMAAFALASSALIAPALAFEGPQNHAQPAGIASTKAVNMPRSSLDLSKAEVQPIEWAPAASGHWFGTLVLNGQELLLDLEASSVRAPGFTLQASRAGQMIDLPTPAVTTHRGQVVDHPGSLVAVSFVASGVHAVIDPGDGTIWYMQPLSEIDANANPIDHVVYRSDAIRATGRSCGGALEVPNGVKVEVPDGFDTRANCLRQAQIGIDMDFTYYGQHGSDPVQCLAYAESIINGMNVIYNRDVNVHFIISASIVRTDNTLYNTADIGTLLGMIQSEWTNAQRFKQRDCAHLFTGQPTGGVIGLAWVDVVCNFSYEYAVSNIGFTGDLGALVGLVSHEVGHNFAAGHCDGSPDCSIMCSGLGGCAGNLSAFSETVIPSLKYAAARGCLENIGPAPTQGGPGAIANSYTITSNIPTRLDVMSNDGDPNCDPLSFFSFPTTTPAGATLSVSTGTGAGGRDELIYTPRTDASGYDTFLYTIQDTSGAQATARVYLSNQTLRDADNAGNTSPGIVASYYRAGGQNALSDFAALTPYKSSTIGAVDFPRAYLNIMGSGRKSLFGALIQGTIIVPATDTYTFFSNSEDGSMLWIDGQAVVKNDFLHNNMTEASGSIALAAGSHAFKVEYFAGSSYWGGLIASWQSSTLAKQVIPSTSFAGPLSINYYDLPAGLSALPSFEARSPYKTSVLAQVNQPSTTGILLDSERSDDLLAAFDGYFVAPTEGLYTLYTQSDDGSKLYIGTNLVANCDGLHGMIEVGGTVNLKAGTHKLRVEWFEAGGSGGLILSVAGPGIDKQVIPASMLVHSNPCMSDFNNDGFVNGDDYDLFAEVFDNADSAADVNDDGFVNGDDYDAFAEAFDAGC